MLPPFPEFHNEICLLSKYLQIHICKYRYISMMLLLLLWSSYKITQEYYNGFQMHSFRPNPKSVFSSCSECAACGIVRPNKRHQTPWEPVKIQTDEIPPSIRTLLHWAYSYDHCHPVGVVCIAEKSHIVLTGLQGASILIVDLLTIPLGITAWRQGFPADDHIVIGAITSTTLILSRWEFFGVRNLLIKNCWVWAIWFFRSHNKEYNKKLTILCCKKFVFFDYCNFSYYDICWLS